MVLASYGRLIAFFRLKRANGAFQGAFMDPVKKAESCTIIDGDLGRLADRCPCQAISLRARRKSSAL